jgi:hypothetical protein
MSFSLESFPFVSSLSIESTRVKRSLGWLLSQAYAAYGENWQAACPELTAYEELLYAIGYDAQLDESGENLAEPDAPENKHVTIVGENVEGVIIPKAIYGPTIGLIDGQVCIAFGGYTAPIRVLTGSEKDANPDLDLYSFQCGIALGLFKITTKERDDKTKVNYLEAEFTIPASDFAPQLTCTVGCNVRKEDGKYIALTATDANKVLKKPTEILAPIGGGDFAIIGEYSAKDAIRTQYVKDGVIQLNSERQPIMIPFKMKDILKGRDSTTIFVKGLAVSQAENEDGDKFWNVNAHLLSNELVALNSAAKNDVIAVAKAGAGEGKEMDWDGIKTALENRFKFPFKVVVRKAKNGTSSSIVNESAQMATNVFASRRANPTLKPATQAQLPSAVTTVDIPATTATVDQTLAAANVEVIW